MAYTCTPILVTPQQQNMCVGGGGGGSVLSDIVINLTIVVERI